MKRTASLIALPALIAVLLLAGCAATADGDGYYTVRRGDTLYSIGRDFDQSPTNLSAWNRLRTAPGNEADHGALGGWDRAGRTIRTAKVVLRSGMVRYLVRGSGRAYASVDSHLIVAGPLHGRVLHEWKGDPERWQWITQDLRPYQGHRAELEFTPLDAGSPLTVARVIDSEAEPGPAEGAGGGGRHPGSSH